MPRSSTGTSTNTLAFGSAVSRDKRYLVLLHTAAEPDVEEWQAYLGAVAQALSANEQLVHCFVATDGGGPNAAQRKQLLEVIEAGRGDLLTDVFTTDRLLRGAVTAFRWIARARAIAHAPGEFESVAARVLP